MASRKWGDGEKSSALSISFDNLGEAAELEFGLWPEGKPIGQHASVRSVLPAILKVLARHQISSTFFVEGWNAEVYEDALRAIVGAGHEIAFHGWRHENWHGLEPDVAERTAARSLSALRETVGDCVGFRPPGGEASLESIAMLARHGVKHVSPVGKEPAIESGVAILPFEWRGVDALYYEPFMASTRAELLGDAAIRAPSEMRRNLDALVTAGIADGRPVSVIFHAYLMIDEPQRFAAFEEFVAVWADHPDLWVAPARSIANAMLSGAVARQNGVN
jgi:peptidoglycan/xylan/chitin deacetylase (PgdA/CDA1 family)